MRLKWFFVPLLDQLTEHSQALDWTVIMSRQRMSRERRYPFQSANHHPHDGPDCPDYELSPEFSPVSLVVFKLDEYLYALKLSFVEMAVRVVEVTPLPKAPDIAVGMINYHGKLIPVLNLRKRFSLPEREIRLNDHIIIANTRRLRVALLVDEVRGMIESNLQEITTAGDIMPRTDYLEGVIKIEGGLILIHDLDTFLSLEEEGDLGDACESSQIC